jgi:hypothetical protein
MVWLRELKGRTRGPGHDGTRPNLGTVGGGEQTPTLWGR